MQNPDSCPQYVVIYEFGTTRDLETFLEIDAALAARKHYEEERNKLQEGGSKGTGFGPEIYPAS
jgi:hypothetical protein